MYFTEPIHQTNSQLPISEPASTTIGQNIQPNTINRTAGNDLCLGKFMQLIWNEVNRLTVMGVIRSEEDKWFFAYRKAVSILSGDK